MSWWVAAIVHKADTHTGCSGVAVGHRGDSWPWFLHQAEQPHGQLPDPRGFLPTPPTSQFLCSPAVVQFLLPQEVPAVPEVQSRDTALLPIDPPLGLGFTASLKHRAGSLSQGRSTCRVKRDPSNHRHPSKALLPMSKSIPGSEAERLCLGDKRFCIRDQLDPIPPFPSESEERAVCTRAVPPRMGGRRVSKITAKCAVTCPPSQHDAQISCPKEAQEQKIRRGQESLQNPEMNVPGLGCVWLTL